MVIASEDVGLAYPNAVVITKACVDSALQLGLPEARIPLAEAVILLANSPKSNSAICAIDEAMHEVETADTGSVPLHLKDSHYKGEADIAEEVARIYGYDKIKSSPLRGETTQMCIRDRYAVDCKIKSSTLSKYA